MKKIIPFTLLFFCFCLALTSCNTATPENYFDQAVLNSNMIVDFADINGAMARELEMPSAKMADNGEAVQMKRSESIGSRIEIVEEHFAKIKALKETADAKDILQASLALHEFVLPVYKNEYVQLARLYDEGAPKEQIQLKANLIHDKYYEQFNKLYDDLISKGKLYAEKHAIKVNWAM